MRHAVLPATLLVLAALACGPKRVTYSLPPVALLPVGAAPPVDRRADYAPLFCGALTHTRTKDDTKWASCDTYLLDPEPPADVSPDDKFAPGLRLLVVGGIFADCVKNERLRTFRDATDHLKAHGVEADYVPVGANSSSADNARRIQAFLARQPDDRKYIAVGHSKGAVDLVEALVAYEDVRKKVKALVTVASPVAGSRLPDFVSERVKKFAERMDDIDACDLGDKMGHRSLERRTRQEYLTRHHAAIAHLKTYGLFGAVSEDETSEVLKGLWKAQAYYSIDQDSQVIADEALLPGTGFLARARGDHWAVAFPLEYSDKPFVADLVNHNRFPRAALLEAALRVVVHDLKP